MTKKRSNVKYNAEEREKLLQWGIDYYRINGAPPTLAAAQAAVFEEDRRQTRDSVSNLNRKWRDQVRDEAARRPFPEAADRALASLDAALSEMSSPPVPERAQEDVPTEVTQVKEFVASVTEAAARPTIADLIVEAGVGLILRIINDARVREALSITPQPAPAVAGTTLHEGPPPGQPEPAREVVGDAPPNPYKQSMDAARRQADEEHRDRELDRAANGNGKPVQEHRKPKVLIAHVSGKMASRQIALLKREFDSLVDIREWHTDMPIDTAGKIATNCDFALFFEALPQQVKAVIKHATNHWSMHATPDGFRKALARIAPRH